MSTLAQVAPIDYSIVPKKELSQYVPPTPYGEVRDIAEVMRGSWYSIGPRAAQAVGLAGAGAADLFRHTGVGSVLEYASPGIFNQAKEEAFAQVETGRAYWGSWYKQTQSQTLAGQILRGLGEFGGGIATSGIAGLGFGAGIDTALNELESGKTPGESLAFGVVRGGADVISAALPFKLGLLRGSGALSATAQRLGYGVGSNVAVGIGQRASEKALLESFGYDKEAASKLVFDPTALAVDTVMGIAFGGAARYLDIRAGIKPLADVATHESTRTAPADSVQADLPSGPPSPLVAAESIEAAIQARRGELQAQAESIPFNRSEARSLDNRLKQIELERNKISQDPEQIDSAKVREIAKELRAADERLSAKQAMAKAEKMESIRLVGEAAQRQSARSELQLEADGITQKLASYNSAKNAAADLNRLDQKLRMADTPEKRAMAAGLDDPAVRELVTKAGKEELLAMESARAKLTTSQVDAALMANLQLHADDMAPGRPSDIGPHRDMMNEMIAAADENRQVNLDNLDSVTFSPDVKIGERMSRNSREIAADIPQESKSRMAEEGFEPSVVKQKFKPEQADESTAADQAIADADELINSLGNDMILIDESGNPKAVADFKKELQQAESEANDEADTVSSIVSCMIGDI